VTVLGVDERLRQPLLLFDAVIKVGHAPEVLLRG
jgi:hypothetical protein